jgi:uncharacterized protein YjdB
MDKDKAILFVGKTMTIPVKVYDQNKTEMALVAANVQWISSEPKVATITSAPDGSGLLVGVSEGAVEVSANITGGTRAISTPPIAIQVVLQIPTTAEAVLPKL